jgi:hypothetical protein
VRVGPPFAVTVNFFHVGSFTPPVGCCGVEELFFFARDGLVFALRALISARWVL